MITTNDNETSGRYWPLWAAAAGGLGYVGHLFADGRGGASHDQVASGVGVVELLDRTNYHIGVVAGLFAVFCLLVFAAGWWRWVAVAAPTSLTASVVPLALAASAGAMILAYGVKGMLAIYLAGGINEGSHPPEGLYTLFIFDDLAPFIAWYGVAIASAAVAWLSLRERRLPIWIGVVSLLLTLAPVAMLILTGLSGFPGLFQPLWLIIVSIGLVSALRRSPIRERQSGFAAVGD